MMNDWYGNGAGAGAWVGMALVMVIFWAGIAMVVILLRPRNRPVDGVAPQRPQDQDAERILDERFARGDIDEEEFTSRRTALRRKIQ